MTVKNEDGKHVTAKAIFLFEEKWYGDMGADFFTGERERGCMWRGRGGMLIMFQARDTTCFQTAAMCHGTVDNPPLLGSGQGDIAPRKAHMRSLQWGAADAEIKFPSGENTEHTRSPFKAWSRSVYSHTCYAYCQGFLPCLFLPFRPIHLHFCQSLSRFFLCWLWLAHGSCVGLLNRIGHHAGGRFPCWVPAEYK